MRQDILNCYRKVNPHVSVDCVLIGFDGEQLSVLLVKRQGVVDKDFCDTKLPGSLIYMDEDLDEAASRVLSELTGLKNVRMDQFKTFGDKDRTSNPKDTLWLERLHSLKAPVDRIITVAYLSLLKVDKKAMFTNYKYAPCWKPVSEVDRLAFDHKQIVQEALVYVRNQAELNPSFLFGLLPRKFTATQMRKLFELVYDRTFDVRNFHKRISQMPYVVALDERETGVPHRAARYYKFDKNKVAK
ncbi:MAG: NUDIX hydrolase [Bacteroidaceae bacterium]|nr:NUDIX hydrolase [Bacteroidaceae bacterium]